MNERERAAGAAAEQDRADAVERLYANEPDYVAGGAHADCEFADDECFGTISHGRCDRHRDEPGDEPTVDDNGYDPRYDDPAAWWRQSSQTGL